MKTLIKTNLSKITLALALIGTMSGITGLIIGSVAHNKTNNISYFLNHDYTITWGGNYMVNEFRYWTKNKFIFWYKEKKYKWCKVRWNLSRWIF